MKPKELLRKDENITIMEAYLALYQFLDDIYVRTKSDAVGSALGDLSLLADGAPFDPASWQDWLNVIDKAKTNKVDANLILTKDC